VSICLKPKTIKLQQKIPQIVMELHLMGFKAPKKTEETTTEGDKLTFIRMEEAGITICLSQKAGLRIEGHSDLANLNRIADKLQSVLNLI